VYIKLTKYRIQLGSKLSSTEVDSHSVEISAKLKVIQCSEIKSHPVESSARLIVIQ